MIIQNRKCKRMTFHEQVMSRLQRARIEIQQCRSFYVQNPDGTVRVIFTEKEANMHISDATFQQALTNNLYPWPTNPPAKDDLIIRDTTEKSWWRRIFG